LLPSSTTRNSKRCTIGNYRREKPKSKLSSALQKSSFRSC